MESRMNAANSVGRLVRMSIQLQENALSNALYSPSPEVLGNGPMNPSLWGIDLAWIIKKKTLWLNLFVAVLLLLIQNNGLWAGRWMCYAGRRPYDDDFIVLWGKHEANIRSRDCLFKDLVRWILKEISGNWTKIFDDEIYCQWQKVQNNGKSAAGIQGHRCVVLSACWGKGSNIGVYGL